MEKSSSFQKKEFSVKLRESLSNLRGLINGIIFDFDGTLYNPAFFAFILISSCPQDIFKIVNERLLYKRLKGCDFLTSQKYYGYFFEKLGKSCFMSPQKIHEWYFKNYLQKMILTLKKHYSPRDGLMELFLNRIEKNNNLKIAVYSDYPCVKERMKAIGLFTGEESHGPSDRAAILKQSNSIKFYDIDSFGALKPAPRPFYEIAKEMQLKPEEILVAGDRKDTDGAGALHSGMHFFHVKSNRSWKKLLDFINT